MQVTLYPYTGFTILHMLNANFCFWDYKNISGNCTTGSIELYVYDSSRLLPPKMRCVMKAFRGKIQ